MKILTILLFSVVALGTSVTSCSKEEAAPVTMEGKWFFDSDRHIKGGKVIEERDYKGPACSDRGYLDLKDGGAMERGTVNSSTATTDPCVLKKSGGTWNLSNDIVRFNFDTGAMTFTLVSLTANELEYKFVNPYEADDYYIFTMKR